MAVSCLVLLAVPAKHATTSQENVKTLPMVPQLHAAPLILQEVSARAALVGATLTQIAVSARHATQKLDSASMRLLTQIQKINAGGSNAMDSVPATLHARRAASAKLAIDLLGSV